MKKIINSLLKIIGYEIKKSKQRGKISFHNDFDHIVGYEFEEEANQAIKIVRKNTMLPYINLITLYEQVLYCDKNNIEGAFVECGVWKGGAVGLMALANMKKSKKRRDLHLFDAFEEICAPNEIKDGTRAINEVRATLGKDAPTKGELVPLKGLYDKFGGPSDINDCKRILETVIKYPPDHILYHKGWFQNTLPFESKKIDKIAILRLDGDWYESTKICLEYLYEKVISGGFVVFDDYGAYSGCKKAVDDFLSERKENYFLNYSNHICRYIQKQ